MKTSKPPAIVKRRFVQNTEIVSCKKVSSRSNAMLLIPKAKVVETLYDVVGPDSFVVD